MENEVDGVAREEFWREIFDGHETSGMSCRNYCNSKGVNYNRFLYWQGKFRRLAKDQTKSLIKKESDFISVANYTETEDVPSESLKEGSYNIELELPFGIKLRVGAIS